LDFVVQVKEMPEEHEFIRLRRPLEVAKISWDRLVSKDAAKLESNQYVINSKTSTEISFLILYIESKCYAIDEDLVQISTGIF
jgi:hypothetical protein